MASMRPAIIGMVVLGTLSWTPAFSQIPQSLAEEQGSSLFNYAFTNEVGFGRYDVGDQTVQSIKLPITHLLQSPVDHKFGIRLRFPVTFASYNLTIADFLEDLNLAALSFVPGVEFLIPFGRRWYLIPRQDLGFTKDFEGGELVFISASAVRGMYIRELAPVVLSLGSGLKYSFGKTSENINDDDFFLVEAGADLRYPLGFSVKGHKVDSSVFFIAKHYFRKLGFGQVDEAPIELEHLYEAGLSFGTTPRPKVFGFRIPRIGVSYLFGEDFRGVKLSFGFPFKPGPRRRL